MHVTLSNSVKQTVATVLDVLIPIKWRAGGQRYVASRVRLHV